MIYLIADNGLTKTDWRLIDSQRNIYQYSTVGLDPYFNDIQVIASDIKNNLLSKIKLQCLEDINKSNVQIHFYAAACLGEKKCQIIKNVLHQNFPNAWIEVEHELLAASRAMCGKNHGIVAIVGSSSDSCYYNGKTIVEKITSMGYVLGDEGSGTYIGKHFIQDFLDNQMPQKISRDFYKTYKLSAENILEEIYSKPQPVIFLASFNKFIYQNRNEKYINNLLRFSFNNFFDKYICKLKNHMDAKLNCVGVIAYYYRDIFREIAEERGIKVDKIIEGPISALTLYHLQKEMNSNFNKPDKIEHIKKISLPELTYHHVR